MLLKHLHAIAADWKWSGEEKNSVQEWLNYTEAMPICLGQNRADEVLCSDYTGLNSLESKRVKRRMQLNGTFQNVQNYKATEEMLLS